MALNIKTDSVAMQWQGSSAKAGVHVGRNYVLLHCTEGANLEAGDKSEAGKIAFRSPVRVVGTCTVEATADETDLGQMQFGMVQVTALHAYQFLYVGRIESEGSTQIDMALGFNGASLDALKEGGSVDAAIFDQDAVAILPAPAGTKGFVVQVAFTDHPNNAVPLQFENRVAKVQNYLARLLRNQHFVVYMVVRDNPTAPVRILGRLGWAVHWDVDLNWQAKTTTPHKPVAKALHLFPGRFMPGPPPAGDAWGNIAINRVQPTTKELDKRAVDDIWTLRKEPLCKQLTTRPDGFRAGFFA